MSIKIKINKTTQPNKPFILPIEVFGAEHGKVFQQLCRGIPQESYLVGTGVNDMPMSIWYDDESKKFRLSGDNSKKTLKEYLSHVKYQEIDAELLIELTIKD